MLDFKDCRKRNISYLINDCLYWAHVKWQHFVNTELYKILTKICISLFLVTRKFKIAYRLGPAGPDYKIRWRCWPEDSDPLIHSSYFSEIRLQNPRASFSSSFTSYSLVSKSLHLIFQNSPLCVYSNPKRRSEFLGVCLVYQSVWIHLVSPHRGPD